MDDPVEVFRAVAAEHRRCFWLDGGGARAWSGRRSIIGWLDDDDVSLSWSAARREVTRHSGGTTEVVGDDVFALLESVLAPGEQWFGYLGAASRADLPATPDPVLPDAVWMRPRGVRVFEHPVAGVGSSRVPPPSRG
ncbi:anthranilate synthase component I family protein, partial [Nocardioides zeicaulis]